MNRLSERLACFLWLSCASCGASAALAPREPNAAPANPVASPSSEPAWKEPVSSDAFIVHSEGRIELRTLGEAPVRVLAEDASGVSVYDPELELIWYTQEEQLFVIDLRAASPAPILIASGVPDVSRLEILQAKRSVRTKEACEGPTLRLHWRESPSVEAYDGDTSETRIDGASWLTAQRARPARVVGATRELEGKPVRLSRKLLDCEISDVCGATAEFGARQLQLVLMLDKSGGDCWNRGCLLRDPQTNRFASPLEQEHWGRAQDAKLGPCGLYYFNRQGSAFLVNSRLCLEGAACVDLGGEALGWLNPGDTVGAVGDPGEEEE